ncbi:WG repeat-containing protein [Chitinophaga solisilvae]|uniref:WG repeat-containing protein n=1 Tax=Chitinophaga solisilvae TaxID=1233460 RepID=UPI00136C7606|nr:WG repeat-containing protein [Chitinophaga solisilvae]
MIRRSLLTAALTGITLYSTAQRASLFSNGLARLEEKGKGRYINTAGEKVFDTIISTYHPVDSIAGGSVYLNENRDVFIVKRDGQFGVTDDHGKWLVPAAYDTISNEWHSYLLLRRGKKMTYASTEGKILLPLLFEEAGILDDTHFDVKQNGKWGIFSVPENKLIVPAIYEKIDYCGGCGSKSEYVYAQQQGKWGVVSFKNDILIPFRYEHSHMRMRADEWVLSFQKNKQPVVINLDLKKEYGPPAFAAVELMGNGLLKAKKNGRYGLINAAGTTVLDFIYDDITDPYGDYASGPYLIITANRKSGVVNENGRIVIPPSVDGDITCKGDYLIISRNGLYNIMDSTGKVLLKKDYTEISPLLSDRQSHGYPPVFVLKEKALYGFYNPGTRTLVAPAFHEVEPLQGHPELIETVYRERTGLYTTDGVQLLPPAYNSYSFLTPTLLSVTTDKGRGVYDLESRKEIFAPVYRELEIFSGNDNWLRVGAAPEDSYDFLYGLRDFKGNEILPAAYNSISAAGSNRYLLQQRISDTASRWLVYDSDARKVTTLPYHYAALSGQPDILIVSDSRNSFLWNAVTGKNISDTYPLSEMNGLPGISGFRKNLSALVKAGKAGVINNKGAIIIPFTYDGATILDNGIILLFRKTADGQFKYGYADSTGKLLVPPEYDCDQRLTTSDFEDSTWLPLYKYDANNYRVKTGVADMQGNIKLPPIYDRVLCNKEGKGFLVQEKGFFSILGPDGKPITSRRFNDVMIPRTPGYRSLSAVYTFPLLCRIDGEYRFVTAQGEMWEVEVKEVIGF